MHTKAFSIAFAVTISLALTHIAALPLWQFDIAYAADDKLKKTPIPFGSTACEKRCIVARDACITRCANATNTEACENTCSTEFSTCLAKCASGSPTSQLDSENAAFAQCG
jgi:hypothetical protein